MGMVPSPISRLRTFREDVNRLQNKNAPQAAAKAEVPQPRPAPKPEAKRLPVPPVVKTAPSITKIATPISASSKPSPQFDATPSTLKTIPKVNEKLSAEISAVGAVKPRSILSQEDRIFDVMDADDYKSEGNIITDRKRERFKLLPAMFTALKEWLTGKREALAEFTTREQEPVATIRPAKTREEILSKAFKQSAMAPRDDHANLATRLQESIRQRPAAASGTLTIKKAAEMPAPSWTHLEGEGETLQSEQSVAVEKIMVESVPEAAATGQSEAQTPTPEPEPPAPIPVEVAPVVEAEPAPIAEPDPTPPPYRPPIVERARREEAPFSMWRVGAVALLAVLLGVSGTVWFFGDGEEEKIVLNENEIQSLVSIEEQIAVPIGGNAESLMRNILAAKPGGVSKTAQVYPTMNLAGDTVPAGAAEIMSVLDTRAPGSFIRAVNAINFGFYRNTEPFIVLKLTSFDTALGGMLAWEESMSADLSPLFGAPVAGTFDPQARTATQIREPYFVDVVVGNHDARVLLDETQKERLIYAFVNRNTVVITQNRDALSSLAALIK